MLYIVLTLYMLFDTDQSIAFNQALTTDLPFHAISESPVRLLYSNIGNRNISQILTKQLRINMCVGK